MGRDWNAEQAEVDAEFYAAKDVRDAAHKPVCPELGNMRKMVSTEDLAIFGEANKRFETAAARRKAFLDERRARDPEWGGAA